MAEIQGLGLAGLGAEAVVPPRRLGELARYGMTADAWLLRRHPDDRRLATLLATARYLEAKSVDDALELLDLLMSAALLNKAQREADRDKTSDAIRLSSCPPRLFGCGREGDGFVVVLAGCQAAVEAAEQAAEQVALGGGVPVAVVASAVVVGAGAG